MIKLYNSYLIQHKSLFEKGYVSSTELFYVDSIAKAYILKKKIDSCMYVCLQQLESAILEQVELKCEPIKDKKGKYAYKKLNLDTAKLIFPNTITIKL